MTTPASNIVKHGTQHPPQRPIYYAAARRLLRSLARKSARLASWAIGLFAAEMHIPQRLFPKKGTGRLPAYQHPPPYFFRRTTAWWTSLSNKETDNYLCQILRWLVQFVWLYFLFIVFVYFRLLNFSFFRLCCATTYVGEIKLYIFVCAYRCAQLSYTTQHTAVW